MTTDTPRLTAAPNDQDAVRALQERLDKLRRDASGPIESNLEAVAARNLAGDALDLLASRAAAPAEPKHGDVTCPHCGGHLCPACNAPAEGQAVGYVEKFPGHPAFGVLTKDVQCGAMLYTRPAPAEGFAVAEPAAEAVPVFAFLLGEGKLEDCWFGDIHPSGRKYWWRHHLRAAMQQEQAGERGPG